MRRLSVLVSLCAVALVAWAALGRGTGTAAQDATPAAAAGHLLVGSWLVDTDADNPANPPSLATFHADGTFLEVDANGDTGVGAWAAAGERAAGLTFRYVFADETGAGAGGSTVRVAVEVAADGQTFTATYTIEVVGPDGASAGEFGPGTATGERIAVEPMGTPTGTLADLFAQFAGTPAAEGTPAP